MCGGGSSLIKKSGSSSFIKASPTNYPLRPSGYSHPLSSTRLIYVSFRYLPEGRATSPLPYALSDSVINMQLLWKVANVWLLNRRTTKHWLHPNQLVSKTFYYFLCHSSAGEDPMQAIILNSAVWTKLNSENYWKVGVRLALNSICLRPSSCTVGSRNRALASYLGSCTNCP